MAKLVALNNQLHKSLRIDPARGEEQGADLHMVPVVVGEFLKLVVNYPILFSKNAETGQFVCVALMGLEEGENLFWQAGQYDSIYLPLNIVRHPFFVGQDEQSGDDYVMCIDVESDAVAPSHAEALFDDQGQATAYLQNAQGILAELIQGEHLTLEYIKALMEHQLLTPLKLDITYADGATSQVNGLYGIDEARLAELTPDTLAQFQQNGYLQGIYTQLASMGQIYALIERKNRRKAEPSAWFKAAGE